MSSLKKRRVEAIDGKIPETPQPIFPSAAAPDPPFSFFSPREDSDELPVTPKSGNREKEKFQSALNELDGVALTPVSEAIKPVGDLDGRCCSYSCRNMVKTELLRTLDKQQHQIDEFRESISKSQKKLFSAETERQSLSYLARQLDAAITGEQAKVVSLQTQLTEETEKSGNLVRRYMNRCDELQVDLSQETRLRKDAESRAELAEARVEELQLALKKMESQSEEDSYAAEAGMEKVLEENADMAARQKAEVHMLECQLAAANGEALALEEQVKGCHVALEESEKARAAVEAELATALLLANERVPSGRSEELERVVKQMREEIDRQAAELARTQSLSQRAARLAVVEEELTQERRNAQELQRQLADAHALVDGARGVRRELDSWQELVGRLPGVQHKEDLPAVLSDLQQGQAVALASQSDLSVRIAEISAQLAAAQAGQSQAERDAASARERGSDLEASLARAERKLALVSRERDSLKALLTSYDAEAELAPGWQERQVDGPYAAREARIQELESTLAACQLALSNQEEALRAEAESAAEARMGVDRCQEEIGQLREQLVAWQREAERDRMYAAAEASQKQAKAEVPSSAGEASQDLLQRQLADLQERLRRAEEEQSATSAPGSLASADVDALRRRVAGLERKEQRLKEVFEQKVLGFREACYCLLGYRVDLSGDPGDSVVVLHSAFADSDDRGLKFQRLSPGEYQMVPTEYSSTDFVEKMAEVFVGRFRSIPAFTANLSIELFNLQTSTM